ncbi:hypothetical protein HMPREF7215_0701 [Pyramidobacter piscolens W5455]|uniref:Uncharacterized protein n=1 Tax=Pyramidobacter piscolens W5455 TaxID=352165 RepID=A0ABM9ZSQ9_9BACT|nr:hypothetical protein HMPREF7215_0701 [Pyramidobacter piscolens W5455]
MHKPSVRFVSTDDFQQSHHLRNPVKVYHNSFSSAELAKKINSHDLFGALPLDFWR